MRRAAGAAVVAALFCAPPAASAMNAPAAGERVAIVYQAYDPGQTTALTGDTVTWTNQSPRTHTVTGADGSFASGSIFSSQMFEHRFDSAGTFRYFCIIHPGMSGEVDVYDLLLDAPARSVAPGQVLTLSGRAHRPAGSPVWIEADSGSGYRPAGSATVADGGRFASDLHPTVSASYRAVAYGGTASPAVNVAVVNRTVAVAASRHGRRAVVAVHVTPAASRGTVVLQVASREHFGWWPTRRARLDRGSRARFTLSTRRRLRMRVLLTLRDGATPLATSRTVRLPAAHR